MKILPRGVNSEQKGAMQWTGTLLRNVACFRLFVTSVRACDVVCPLDTAAVTELWRLDLFSCSSSSFFCTLSCWCAVFERQMSLFFAEGLVRSRQPSPSKGFSYYFHLARCTRETKFEAVQRHHIKIYQSNFCYVIQSLSSFNICKKFNIVA